ncbi:TPA: hypothetical protein IWI99_002763, partial [Enterococcus faecium]|nr:hypothetical protein [Enterococcus faecium]
MISDNKWEINLKRFISEYIYTIETKSSFSLNEDSDPLKKYTIQCKKNKDEKLFVIRPDLMKSNTHYIKEKPKDCDYIIISEANKTVFLIELKSSAQTSPAKEISEQIDGGYKWLQHLSFLTKYDFTEFSYKIIKVCCKFEARQDRKNLFKPNEYGIYNMNGP